MFIKQIKLTNFRNYSSLDYKFTTPVTVLYGDNAQGKSSFLEAIYFLATSKSPKADKDEELIKQGEGVGRVEGIVIASEKRGNLSGEIPTSQVSLNDKKSEDEEIKLEIVMQLLEGNLTKRVRVNGIPKKVLDYTSNLAVILFSPEDLNLVIGSPSTRRAHVDQIISQVDRRYKKTLSLYEDVVVRKNKILKAIKDGLSKINELTYWTDQQILLGNSLQTKRIKFFEFINGVEKKFGNFSYEYIQNLISKERLEEYQIKEVESCSSLIGPHREDFVFRLKDNISFVDTQDDNGKDLAIFGSRGEQRTAVLDLKLAEVAFVENVLGERPILLLDDIFSELDLSHRQHVIDLSTLQQTIIAAVELDSYLKKHLKEAEIIEVKEGAFS